MRKPYIRKKENPNIKQQQLLTIEEHGFDSNDYRKIYQKVNNNWVVVAIGCMNCNKSYHSLTPAINHISKCERREINSLTEDD